MSDTPDLSKIVNLIMQNPHLISEIQSLAKGEKKDEGEESSEAQTRTEASVKADVPQIGRASCRERVSPRV